MCAGNRSMWFWLAIIALLCWSGSDLFSKIGCRDGRDKYNPLKMVIAVGVVMGIHAAYEIFVGGAVVTWHVMWTYLPVSLLYIGSMTLGYVGLRYIELSISSPICNSSGALVAVLCRPVVGWMLDNGKRRAILLIGLIGMLLMPLGYMFASVIFLAFVFRMVHGASLALSNTATATIASDVIPAPRFAEGMGMFGMATALATSCAPALGLYLMDSFSYTVLFACASGSVLIALILFAILKNPPIKAEKKPLNVSALFSRAAVPASVIALIFMLTFGALENFLAKYAVEAELPSGGLFFAIMAVMLLLVRVVLGKYADKKGEAMFVYTCNSAMLAAFLLLALAPNTVTFIIAAVLAGYGFGGLEPALQSMAVHSAAPSERGSANSTFLCAYDIGIGLGGGIAGVLISGLGYEQMFVILSAANIVSVLLYILWGRNDPSSISRSLRIAKDGEKNA